MWLHADDLVGTEGSNVTAWADRSGNANDAAAFATNIGTLELASWNGARAVRQNAQAASITGATAAAVINGTNQEFTVIMASQLWGAATTNMWSAGAGAGGSTSEYIGTEAIWSTTLRERWKQRFSAAGQTLDTGIEDLIQAPQVWLWSRTAAGLVTRRRDGIDENTFTRTDGGILVERIMIGGLSQGTSATAGTTRQRVRQFMLIGGLLTTDERAAIELYCAQDGNNALLWKKGLGGGLWAGTTYVFLGQGQSNLNGRGTGTAQTITSTKWYHTDRKLQLRTMADPVSAIGSYDSYSNFATAGTNSIWPALANAFDAQLGATDRAIVVDCSIGGTSAVAWAGSATATPPDPATLVGVAKARIQDVMRNAPNAVLAATINYQGEDESDEATSAPADAWDTSWAANLNEWIAYATAKGWTWRGATKRHLIIELPATPYASGTYWTNVQARQLALDVARADTDLVQASSLAFVDAPVNLHLQTSALNATGTLAGASVAAF